jgi:hypothetical protein
LKLHLLAASLFSLISAACSTAEKKPNSSIGKVIVLNQEFKKISLDHPAKLSVALIPNSPTFISCKDHLRSVKIEIYKGLNSFTENLEIPLECPYRMGMINGQTKQELPVGDYRIRYRPGDSNLFRMATAKVMLKDKSFASGSNQVIEGATPLEKDSRVNEAIDAKNGDPYDWIELKGRSGKAKITFINEPSQAKLKATLYKKTSDGRLHRVSDLTHKQSKTYNMGADPLFFKVEGTLGKYTLIRSDVVVPVELQVLDIYRISAKQWNVALSHKGELKDGLEVVIKGQSIETKALQSISRCTVTKVEEKVAFCVFEREADLAHRNFQGEIL